MLITFTFLDCGHFVFITSTLAYYLRRCIFLISFVSHSFQPSGSNQVKYSNNYKFKCLKERDALERYKLRSDGRFTGHTSLMKTDIKKNKTFCN